MDRHELTRVVEAERLDLCDFLEDLEASDWLAGSLCPGWTVHDVVAHLTTISMPMSVWDTIKGAISARGDFNRMTADQARRRAAVQPAALVARLRETAGSSRRAAGHSTRSSKCSCMDRTSRGRSGARGRCHRTGSSPPWRTPCVVSGTAAADPSSTSSWSRPMRPGRRGGTARGTRDGG